ncbi:hypothetical protein C0992_005867, partial [Termitomyces sp. T32_za158]
MLTNQNGKAERYIRTIEDTAQSLMAWAGIASLPLLFLRLKLLDQFWTEQNLIFPLRDVHPPSAPPTRPSTPVIDLPICPASTPPTPSVAVELPASPPPLDPPPSPNIPLRPRRTVIPTEKGRIHAREIAE